MKRKNTEFLEENPNKRGLLVNTTRIPINRPPKALVIGQKEGLTGKETVLDLLTLLQGTLTKETLNMDRNEKGPVAPFQMKKNKKQLKLFLEDLYPQTRPAASFPERCSVCQCRFKLQKELKEHLDEHFRQNNRGYSNWKEAQKMDNSLSSKARFRGWEPPASDWLQTGATGPRFASLQKEQKVKGKEQKETEQKGKLIIDGWSQEEFDISVCWICREQMHPKHFSGFIDGVLVDEWYYENATYLAAAEDGSGQKRLVHISCFPVAMQC